MFNKKKRLDVQICRCANVQMKMQRMVKAMCFDGQMILHWFIIPAFLSFFI
jgi:hypothetical protein